MPVQSAVFFSNTVSPLNNEEEVEKCGVPQLLLIKSLCTYHLIHANTIIANVPFIRENVTEVCA